MLTDNFASLVCELTAGFTSYPTQRFAVALLALGLEFGCGTQMSRRDTVTVVQHRLDPFTAA